MAYSTLDPELDCFRVEGAGFLAFKSLSGRFFGGTTLAFFDPVCSPAARRRLLKEFIASNRRHGFIQIGAETAEILAGWGYYVNQLGIETRVPLADFSLQGNARARLREAWNRGRRLGACVEELRPCGGEELYQQMRSISDEWIASRKVHDREIRVIVRKAVFSPEPFVRKFILRNRDGRVDGFVFFDPVFSQQRVIGYSPSVLRFRNTSFKGRGYFMILSLMERFKAEGVAFLDLGLSPFYNLKVPPMKTSPAMGWLFRRIFRHGESLYGFKGLAEHKRQFRGEERPTYIASPAWFPLAYIYATFKVVGVL
jgi:lysylphosphatidylglycerol synthetase-like protein (DUF2156 family)